MATIDTLFDTFPNLRNGQAANYVVVHIAAGIPEHFHFRFSDHDFAQGEFMRFLVVETAMYSVELVASGVAIAEARRQAVVLAAVRLGIMKAWRIQEADLIAAQTKSGDQYANFHRPNLDAMTVPANDTDVPELSAAAYPDPVVREEVRLLEAEVDLFDPHVIANLLRMGMAMPVITGVILVKTDGQHHFLPQHKNVFRAVQRQIFGSGDTIPFGLDSDTFEDIVAHKSTHPIDSRFMMQIARAAGTKAKLVAAGLASAAVRVPAQFAPESAMSGIVSLVRKVVAIARAANVASDMTRFENQATAVFNALDLATPQGRADATTQAATFTETHGVDLARCMGILQATCENATIAPPALMRSHALRRVVEENPASVAEGVAQMAAFGRAQRDKARRGIVSGMSLFGAAVPEDTPALPADETLAQILRAVMGNTAPAAAQNGNPGN